MRTLALDQSSRITGWALFDDGTLIEYGKIDAGSADMIQRLIKLKKEVIKLIDKYDVDQVILEDIQMQKNVNNVVTFKVLAFTLGMLEIWCAEQGIPYQIIGSSSWKKTCGVVGKARPEQKRDAQRFVLEKFEVKAIQDTVDAICLGYAATKTAREVNWA